MSKGSKFKACDVLPQPLGTPEASKTSVPWTQASKRVLQDHLHLENHRRPSSQPRCHPDTGDLQWQTWTLLLCAAHWPTITNSAAQRIKTKPFPSLHYPVKDKFLSTLSAQLLIPSMTAYRECDVTLISQEESFYEAAYLLATKHHQKNINNPHIIIFWQSTIRTHCELLELQPLQ